MISIDDLRKTRILGYLDDEMLEKVKAVADVLTFNERDVIFRGGDVADYLYLVKRGKILLEQRLSEKVTVSVGSITDGFSFGWGAMLGDALYSLDAICAEDSEVFVINGETLHGLMNDDPALGFRIMQRFLLVVKSRLDRRTEQFLRVITSHPDIVEFQEVEN